MAVRRQVFVAACGRHQDELRRTWKSRANFPLSLGSLIWLPDLMFATVLEIIVFFVRRWRDMGLACIGRQTGRCARIQHRNRHGCYRKRSLRETVADVIPNSITAIHHWGGMTK